jgi:hypothetical protein
MNSSNDSNDNYINSLNTASTSLYKYVLLLFYVMGNVGNLLSVLVFSKKSWRKNVCVFYFKVYILYSSCYVNSSVLGSVFIFGYQVYLQNSAVVLCKLYFYAALLFATLTPTILILASIDRLLISSQNVDTRLYSSKRLAYFSISLGTCFWFIFNIHTLIKVNIQESYPSVFICYYDLSKSYRDFVSYSLTGINVSYSLIMIILCSFSFKNIRYIRIVPRQQRNQVRSVTKKDFQLLRCLFAHGIAYIIFCTGIYVYYVYDAIRSDGFREPLEQAIDIFVNNFLTFLYNIFFCISFFIFAGISKAFRHELKRLAYKMVGRGLLLIRDEENKQENVELNVVVISNIVLPA